MACITEQSKVLTTNSVIISIHQFLCENLEDIIAAGIRYGAYPIEICKLDTAMFWFLTENIKLQSMIEETMNSPETWGKYPDIMKSIHNIHFTLIIDHSNKLYVRW